MPLRASLSRRRCVSRAASSLSTRDASCAPEAPELTSSARSSRTSARNDAASSSLGYGAQTRARAYESRRNDSRAVRAKAEAEEARQKWDKRRVPTAVQKIGSGCVLWVRVVWGDDWIVFLTAPPTPRVTSSSAAASARSAARNISASSACEYSGRISGGPQLDSTNKKRGKKGFKWESSGPRARVVFAFECSCAGCARKVSRRCAPRRPPSPPRLFFFLPPSAARRVPSSSRGAFSRVPRARQWR